MRLLTVVAVAALLALAGCGDDDPTPIATTGGQAAGGTTTTDGGDSREGDDRTVEEDDGQAQAAGTTITVGDSEFGTMLFGPEDQAIYVFERDPDGETVCYDACADAWPPVYADGDPVAGDGIDASLLGTVERRDGRLQATYAGKPLYFYAHEGPGEVRCHNVNLNGGLWWVVAPDGEPRP